MISPSNADTQIRAAILFSGITTQHVAMLPRDHNTMSCIVTEDPCTCTYNPHDCQIVNTKEQILTQPYTQLHTYMYTVYTCNPDLFLVTR